MTAQDMSSVVTGIQDYIRYLQHLGVTELPLP